MKIHRGKRTNTLHFLWVSLALASTMVATKWTEPTAGDYVIKNRTEKVLSLFNVVSFRNEGCRSSDALMNQGSQSTNRNGTCYTMQQCAQRGGAARGACAAGFGVCCVFIITGSGTSTTTVTENCTYVQNPGFPSPTNTTSAVTYTVMRIRNDVCFLRLDFETFTILGPSTSDMMEGPCPDMFSVTTTAGSNVPQICGENSGEHIYADIGRNPGDMATLSFTFAQGMAAMMAAGGGSRRRSWDIKVTQVECSSPCRPPSGCLQFHTGLTGRIMSFNFDAGTMAQHLNQQNYNVCLRSERGFCCVRYQLCSDMDSSSLNTDLETSKQDSNCSGDFIAIAGSSSRCDQGASTLSTTTRYCGPFLNDADDTSENTAICDCTDPFMVSIFTDGTTDMAGMANTNRSRGICLEYMRIPCQ